MSDYLAIRRDTLDDIGDAIKEASGSPESFPGAEIAERIRALGGSGPRTLFGVYRCNGLVFDSTVTAGISLSVAGYVSAMITNGSDVTQMTDVARISLMAEAGDGYGNYVNLYDASSNSIGHDYVTYTGGYDLYVFFKAVEEVSKELYTAFSAMFTPVSEISAGSYRMTSYSYNFNWPETQISGFLSCDFCCVTEQPFNSISNDGEFYVRFNKDGNQQSELNPSWNSDFTTLITLTRPQYVTSDFRRWWDACFALASADAEEEVLLGNGGTYRLSSTWYDEDYTPSGFTLQAISAKVTGEYSGYVANDTPITEIRASHGELGFYNGDTKVLYVSPGWGGGAIYITLDTPQSVASGFATWFAGHTTPVDGGAAGGAISEAVLRAGTYVDDPSSRYPLSYDKMQKAEYTVEADLLGEYDMTIVERVVISGYDGSTNEPCAYATFYRSDGTAAGSTGSAADSSVEFVLSANTTVPIDFYVAFTGMFIRKN